MTTISKNLAADYEHDGFLSGVDVFSTKEIDEYRAAFDKIEQREGTEKCQVGLKDLHFTERFIWDMVTDHRVLEAMRAVMGPDILLLATHFFCKFPEADPKTYVAWHQDVLYWWIEPPLSHTAWIAIDDSDEGNGCMQVKQGTHHKGLVSHGLAEKEGNLLRVKNQEIEREHLENTKTVDLVLRAGQMSIHHGQIFHGSLPNRSDRRRCGLTGRFIPTHVDQPKPNSTGGKYQPILVSGEDRYGHFEKLPLPYPLPGAQG